MSETGDIRTQSAYGGDFETIKGKKYLRAHSAIDWFRQNYPIPLGRIITSPVSDKPLMWRAEIWIEDTLVAVAHASETPVNHDMAKLETNAVRRALAYAGYGTESAIGDDDFDNESGQSLPHNDPVPAQRKGSDPVPVQGGVQYGEVWKLASAKTTYHNMSEVQIALGKPVASFGSLEEVAKVLLEKAKAEGRLKS